MRLKIITAVILCAAALLTATSCAGGTDKTDTQTGAATESADAAPTEEQTGADTEVTETESAETVDPEQTAADTATTAEQTAEPVTETESVAETTAAPVTEKATEPVTEKVTEPVTEPATEKVTEPVTEPATEKVTEAVTEKETETEPVVEYKTVAELLSSGKPLKYTAKQIMFMSPQTVNGVSYRQLQGGCTDGEYMYFAMNDTKSEDSYTLIYKIKLGEKTAELVSEPLQMDHANDMTYDPDNNRLVVCNNAPNKKKLTFVDADTLRITGTHTLGFKAYCVQYVAEKQRYVIGVAGTMDVAITDAEFNLLERLPGEKTGYTKQGVDADENYIYFIQYNKNVVVIYDWSYERVDVIDVPVSGCEPENMFHAGNDFYIGCAAGGLRVYQITLGVK